MFRLIRAQKRENHLFIFIYNNKMAIFEYLLYARLGTILGLNKKIFPILRVDTV